MNVTEPGKVPFHTKKLFIYTLILNYPIVYHSPDFNYTTTPGDNTTMDVHLSWYPARPVTPPSKVYSITYPTNVDYSGYPDAHIYYILVLGKNFLVENTVS